MGIYPSRPEIAFLNTMQLHLISISDFNNMITKHILYVAKPKLRIAEIIKC